MSEPTGDVRITINEDESNPIIKKDFVIKRNGKKQPLDVTKIHKRITTLCSTQGRGPNSNDAPNLTGVDIGHLVKSLCAECANGMSTRQLDELAAEKAVFSSTTHRDYGELSVRLLVSSLHKDTPSSFLTAMCELFKFDLGVNKGGQSQLISDRVMKVVNDNHEMIESKIDYTRDYYFNYFGLKTLMKSYLLKKGTQIVERPQHMFMRVALGIHHEDLEGAFETYDALSKMVFIHATPTLFNAGTVHNQMSSCFLLTMISDDLADIYETIKRCALISKYAGGIGFNIHKIRGKGSYIKGTGGYSNGIIPLLKNFNETARYIDQGGGKRKGSFAVYLEPWHSDIMSFLELRLPHGDEDERARDLFTALWIPDLFMQRVMDNGPWSLFSEDTAPGLSEVYGEEFEILYKKYENTPGLARKVTSAQTVYKAICASIVQTGIPYILFKDTCNRFSNHNQLGTIKCSNLCTEIIQYSSPEEIAVCNLASIALPKFVRPLSDEKFDHPELERVTRLIVRNENKIIDVEFYPLPQCELSNLKHRPMGIGIQGLADAFQMLMLPFDSDEAKVLNREIFETIYFAALDETCRLAEKFGKTYPSYKGSQISRGVLHFDHYPGTILSDRHDWKGLRERIAEFGIYNSLLVAPMPTASTSQIIGNNEAFEPYTTNIYSRRTLAGDFVVINPHLVEKLTELGLWNENMKNTIIQHNGSVQNINSIPPKVKQVFRTAWEIKSSSLIAMAADRAPFIDQHQSLNLFVETPTINLIWNAHLMAWKHKVKGLYYMRSKPASQALKFTINKNTTDQSSQAACPYRPGQAPPDCASCGS